MAKNRAEKYVPRLAYTKMNHCLSSGIRPSVVEQLLPAISNVPSKQNMVICNAQQDMIYSSIPWILTWRLFNNVKWEIKFDDN